MLPVQKKIALCADVFVWVWTLVPCATKIIALFADIVAWFWTYVPSGTNVYALLSRKKSTGRCKLEKCLARLLISVCGFVQPCQGSSEKNKLSEYVAFILFLCNAIAAS